jgi:hypothetical protein
MSEETPALNSFETCISWMESLIPDKAAPDSGQKNNEYSTQIDDLLASIEAPPPKPRIDENCPDTSDLTPDPVTSVDDSQNPAGSYRISDPVDYSEEESDSEDLCVDDSDQVHGQQIPDWARATNLLIELQKQQTVDPDKIFVNFDRTCDLNLMFQKQKRTFTVRGDSGWWAADGLTPTEEVCYKKAIGLA